MSKKGMTFKQWYDAQIAGYENHPQASAAWYYKQEEVDALQKHIVELKEETQDRADTEASLVKQLMKSDNRRKELEKILGMDTPFPVWEILRELIPAAETLLHHYNYDGHGYEGIGVAVDYAKKLLPPKPESEGGADCICGGRGEIGGIDASNPGGYSEPCPDCSPPIKPDEVSEGGV